MALLLIPSKSNAKVWCEALKQIEPKLDIRVWPEVGNPHDIEFALVWKYPPGELKNFPNLKCISSLGAGVEHILQDPQRPTNIPVVRIIDAFLVRDMTRYVVWAVLNYQGQFDGYYQQQTQKQWLAHFPENKITIGILGLGQMGLATAQALQALKFEVIGYSRTAKKIPDMQTFYGENQLPEFLSRSNILINLLPLTSHTENILNQKTFTQLPKNAYLINVGRGGHLNETDLLTAIENGQLSGACLDVFANEPLPENHAFWHHPKIRLTPHIASITNAYSVAPQVIENYHRSLTGKPLLNQIDIPRGY